MHFFDKLEDKIRNLLSRLPILYALVGGVGIILFWRGVWHTADFISYYFLAWGNGGNPTIDLVSAYDGPISFVLGFLMLLSTGLWVSNFIGAEIIISGLRREKKVADRNVQEIHTELEEIAEVKKELTDISKKIDQLAEKR